MTSGAGARPVLLAAARRIVLRDGAGRLTIQAVATEAGVSRGGLLYHFASKDDLLEALIMSAIHGMADPDSVVDSDTPGAVTRAYLMSSLQQGPAPARADPNDSSPDNGLMAALAAAVALQPHLLAPLRKLWQRWQERLEDDGYDPAVATLIRLAIDGLVFSDVYGIGTVDPRLRRDVIAAATRLLDTSAEQPSNP